MPTGNIGEIIEYSSILVITTATLSFSKSPSSWYHKILPAGSLGSCALRKLQRRNALRDWKALVLEDRRTYSSVRPPQWSTSASSNCPATTGAMSTSIPSEKQQPRLHNTTGSQADDVITRKRASALCWQEMARAENSFAQLLKPA